jgi:hypothetical protein
LGISQLFEHRFSTSWTCRFCEKKEARCVGQLIFYVSLVCFSLFFVSLFSFFSISPSLRMYRFCSKKRIRRMETVVIRFDTFWFLKTCSQRILLDYFLQNNHHIENSKSDRQVLRKKENIIGPAFVWTCARDEEVNKNKEKTATVCRDSPTTSASVNNSNDLVATTLRHLELTRADARDMVAALLLSRVAVAPRQLPDEMTKNGGCRPVRSAPPPPPPHAYNGRAVSRSVTCNDILQRRHATLSTSKSTGAIVKKNGRDEKPSSANKPAPPPQPPWLLERCKIRQQALMMSTAATLVKLKSVREEDPAAARVVPPSSVDKSREEREGDDGWDGKGEIPRSASDGRLKKEGGESGDQGQGRCRGGSVPSSSSNGNGGQAIKATLSATTASVRRRHLKRVVDLVGYFEK